MSTSYPSRSGSRIESRSSNSHHHHAKNSTVIAQQQQYIPNNNQQSQDNEEISLAYLVTSAADIVYELEDSETQIGRSEACDIVSKNNCNT